MSEVSNDPLAAAAKESSMSKQQTAHAAPCRQRQRHSTMSVGAMGFNSRHSRTVILLLVICVIGGCATPLVEPAQLNCGQITREIRYAEQGRLLALEKQRDPWAYVTPVAVGGVHVASKSAVSAADVWLARLHQEFDVKACEGTRRELPHVQASG
jgi:hypothetical protein